MKTRSIANLLAAAVLSVSFGVTHAQSSDAAPAATEKNEKKQERAANHTLAKHVRSALYKTKGLVSSGITVLAKDGVVSLTGTVPEQGQIDLAGKAAQSVSGVTSVTNNVELAIKN
jgi:hyperosmotically inducible periplasmic protein